MRTLQTEQKGLTKGDIDSESQQPDTVIRQQILEKVRKRMKDLEVVGGTGNLEFCAELHPDVIVISDDQSLLFEPQSLEVTEWLRRHFGLENLGIRDRIRVHPCQRRGIIAELKAAGFEVV